MLLKLKKFQQKTRLSADCLRLGIGPKPIVSSTSFSALTELERSSLSSKKIFSQNNTDVNTQSIKQTGNPARMKII